MYFLSKFNPICMIYPEYTSRNFVRLIRLGNGILVESSIVTKITSYMRVTYSFRNLSTTLIFAQVEMVTRISRRKLNVEKASW